MYFYFNFYVHLNNPFYSVQADKVESFKQVVEIILALLIRLCS